MLVRNNNELYKVTKTCFLNFQVRVEVINMEDNECYKNYKKIGATVEGWVDEFPADNKASTSTGVAGLIMTTLALMKLA